MKNLILLLLLFTQSAFATQSYVMDQFYLGHSIRNLKSGLLIGRLTETPSADLRGANTPMGLLSSQTAQRQEEYTRVQSEALATRLNLVNLTSNATAASESVAVVPQKRESVDLIQFNQCASRTLGILMLALNAKTTQNDAESTRILLETNAERAVDGERKASGMACGWHLGPLAVLKPASLIEEIKWLKALSSKTGCEQIRLVRAWVGANRFTESGTEESLWKYIWNKLSIQSVFAETPLPPISSVAGHFLDQAGNYSNTSITFSNFNIESALGKGLALSNVLPECAENE